MRKSLVLAIILILQLPLLGVGQSFYSVRRDRKLVASIGSGASKYYGELVGDGEIGTVRLHLNGGLEYLMTPRISLRTDLTWFQLSGTDEGSDLSRRFRNLSFVSNNFELDFGGSIQVFPDDMSFSKRHAFNLYGILQVGLLYFNPKAEYEGEMIALQPLQTEGVKYSRFQFVIPAGVGLKVMINPFLNIALEGIYRETFTDYLDDISSRNYPDPATLIGGVDGLSAQLSDRRIGDPPYNPARPGRRGNPEGEDSYFILTAKVQYFIPTSFGSKKLYTVKRKSNKHKGMFKVKKGSTKRR